MVRGIHMMLHEAFDAAARIDREIVGADTPIPEPEAEGKASEHEPNDQPTEAKFEPYKGKYRKPGTGCVTMINDHLYEGRFSPRVNGKPKTIGNFFDSVLSLFTPEVTRQVPRLQQIEAELEEERKKQEKQSNNNNYKN